MPLDRPLTDAQERFLIGLADGDRDHAVGAPAGMTVPRVWHDPAKLRPHGLPVVRNDARTRASLRDVGLIEVRTLISGLVGTPRVEVFVRLSRDGQAMLRSMGD